MWQLAPGTEIRWQGEYGDNGPAPAPCLLLQSSVLPDPEISPLPK